MTRVHRLNAARGIGICAVVFAAWTLQVDAQSQSASTAPVVFDVVSIKPNLSASVRPRAGFRPGRFEAVAATVQDLIAMAYSGDQIRRSQIIGAPQWTERERFDVIAHIEDTSQAARVTPDRMLLMVQNLLVDRFTLVVHWEKREQPIYTLTFAKAGQVLGPKLRRADADCDTRSSRIPANAAARPVVCGMEGTAGRALGRTMTLSDFATRQLSRIVDRVVVDRTGAVGIFDWDLEWTPGPGEVSPLSSDTAVQPPPDAPSIFAALEEQLGLKLDTERAQVDVLVVDSVRQPSPD